MQTYSGNKIVNAKPMNRLDYNLLRGWTLPEDENGADDGYLVEYTDGGAPNHPDFLGYISWSPKEQFENAYLSLGTTTDLQSYQVRLLAEQVHLTDRIAKAKAYLLKVDKTDQKNIDLIDQVNAMQLYSNALAKRISQLV